MTEFDGLECPECKSKNTDIVNPLSMFSDLWGCKECGLHFREHFSILQSDGTEKKGTIEIIGRPRNWKKS